MDKIKTRRLLLLRASQTSVFGLEFFALDMGVEGGVGHYYDWPLSLMLILSVVCCNFYL